MIISRCGAITRTIVEATPVAVGDNETASVRWRPLLLHSEGVWKPGQETQRSRRGYDPLLSRRPIRSVSSQRSDFDENQDGFRRSFQTILLDKLDDRFLEMRILPGFLDNFMSGIAGLCRKHSFCPFLAPSSPRVWSSFSPLLGLDCGCAHFSSTGDLV